MSIDAFCTAAYGFASLSWLISTFLWIKAERYALAILSYMLFALNGTLSIAYGVGA